MILPRIVFLLVLTTTMSLAASEVEPPTASGPELHAHLFMKEGMGWMFTGDFFEPLHARDWRDRFLSAANPEAMKRSGLRICVAALYANSCCTLSLRGAIRRQVEQARKFVAENPDWRLATTPAEARAALKEGKSALILALEGAAGIIENEDDAREFIDRDGIRIVTLLHLTDDRFGGVSFLKGILILANPWAAVKSLFSPARDADGIRVNPVGLSEDGRALAGLLVAHHAWVDLSHASDASTAALIPFLRERGQPILYTHTTLRRFLRAERGITAEELQAVRETKGMVGVMPAEDMLEGTTEDNGLAAFEAQVREMGRVIGDDGVALGSDWNGGVRHLHPARGTRTSLDEERGFWNLGQSRELWSVLGREAGAATERFLQAWEKVFAAPGAKR